MIPTRLRALKGDNILEKFNGLVAYVDSQKALSTDNRVQINETSNGTNITLLPEFSALNFAYPLKINLLSDKLYTVSEGYVNNESPKIKTGNTPQLVDILHEGKNKGLIKPSIPPKGPDEQWLFCVVILQDTTGPASLDRINAIYIDCLNSQEIHEQEIIIPDMVLGGPHPARAIDGLNGKREFYVPLAFMNADRVLHQFTMHNVYLRPYKVGTQHRVVFWPA